VEVPERDILVPSDNASFGTCGADGIRLLGRSAQENKVKVAGQREELKSSLSEPRHILCSPTERVKWKVGVESGRGKCGETTLLGQEAP
jgi:hypothetical protein